MLSSRRQALYQKIFMKHKDKSGFLTMRVSMINIYKITLVVEHREGQEETQTARRTHRLVDSDPQVKAVCDTQLEALRHI